MSVPLSSLAHSLVSGVSEVIPTLIVSSLGFSSDAESSDAPYTYDPHTVSREEALSYYAGLHSKPTLLYRTNKEKWSPPSGFKTQCYLKELSEVFAHPITQLWNHNLGWKVVEIMDVHTIHFTTIDVVQFKKVKVDEVPGEDEEDAGGEERKCSKELEEGKAKKPVKVYEAPEDAEDASDEEEDKEGETKKPVIGPVTIWIGVCPESTSATAAHDAAQDILALLTDYHITDVEVEFRESFYVRKVGPQLPEPTDELNPHVDIISPLIPALGLGISTKARPDGQGTMALYLAEGSGKNRLLGLSCRHVLIGSKEGNDDYVHHSSGPPRNVLFLGDRTLKYVANSIQVRIGTHDEMIQAWRQQIKRFEEEENGTDTTNIERALAARIRTQLLLDNAEKENKALGVLLHQINVDWKDHDNRILGPILRSPAIAFSVGEHCFTEDWGIFQIDRAKLGDNFQGNKIDLGTKLSATEFNRRCYPRGDANWKFEYPKNCLLPLRGIVMDKLMRDPDMWDADKEPCLLVVKNGNATGTTIGRANGVFSIVREDMSTKHTSMEWAILNYNLKSEVFSDSGDSGSVIADIRGRIGGMLTGGSDKKLLSANMTYATPFWWLLKRIRANGFPNAHLNVNP